MFGFDQILNHRTLDTGRLDTRYILTTYNGIMTYNINAIKQRYKILNLLFIFVILI